MSFQYVCTNKVLLLVRQTEQMKQKHPPVSREVPQFRNPSRDYIVTLRAKGLSQLFHPKIRKNTPPVSREVSQFHSPAGIRS